MKVSESLYSLESLIEKAKDIHGHLGPFLVIGVKMSLAGLKRLDAGDWHNLRVEAELPRQVPYTCTLDGIQATTRCTFGNQKLKLKEADSKTISARFRLKNSNIQVVVSLKNEVIHDIMEKLRGARSEESVERFAWAIAHTPEDELFSITVQ